MIFGILVERNLSHRGVRTVSTVCLYLCSNSGLGLALDDATAYVGRVDSKLTHLMTKLPAAAQEQILSILQTAENRLEYLTPNDWALIVDRSALVSFKKQDALIQKDKQSRTVYLLVKGSAKIEADFRARIAEIGPGQICGEMAFLENGVASASVTAQESVEACAIEWSALNDLFELFPHLASRFYRSLAVSLSRRLRDQIVLKSGSKK